MKVAARIALGAALIAMTGAAMAQMPAVPAAVPSAPIVRPLGSVPLMVPTDTAPPGKDCDAACLIGLAQQYMDALAKQDGSKLPWADRVRYAENGVPMMVGDGVWAAATAHGAAPLIIADPKIGKAIWLGSVDEHGQPGFFALELTARGDRIASVQAHIRRKEGRPPFGDPVAFKHDPTFSTPLAKGKETPRASMFGLVQAYFDAQEGVGSNRGKAPAFAKGCVLIENGLPMTGNQPAAKGETGDCATSFSRGLFGEFEDVRRRIAAYDEARGIVVAIGARDLPAAKTEFAASDGKSYKGEAEYPRSFAFTTVFKIEGGAIARVETIATELPYLMPPPWQEPRGPRP